MKQKLLKMTLLLCALVVGSTSVWAAEEVYKTALFGSSYNSQSVSSYTATWTSTNKGFTVSLANFNNNNNGWDYVKCGRKNNASVGTITTSTTIDKAITKVDVTIDAITADKVNSIKLYTSSDNSTWTEAGLYTKATGAQSVALSIPTANLYFKIEFDCAAGTANGLVTVSKVEYYYNSGGDVTPTCATPTFSPVAGTYTSAQNVTISSTEGATIYYTTDGTDPTIISSVYSAAIPVSTTTTIKAIAVKDGFNNSSVATATYTIETPITIAEVREQGTGSVFTQGIVTSCVGTTAYIQDATAAICVYGATLTIGDQVNVSGILTTYNGLLEITSPIVTVVSSDNTVTPTVKTIAEINADYAADNALQGWLIKIENATITAINGQNTTIAQDENVIVVRGTLGVTVAVNDIITLTGNIGCYNAAQIANPKDVVVATNTNPVINAENVNIAYDATSGEIAYTITNPTEATLTATTTAEWISNIAVTADKVTFTTTANEGVADRTATFTLSYTGAADKEVTITQAHFVADYATLPFEWNDTSTPTGVTNSGVGTYASSPYLKFDGTGDYVILKINERPGTLTFDIKGNSFSGGTFKVQTSEDGTNYTDLKTYTELSSTLNESFNYLGENVRYIKWIYTEKVSGNVALGNITLAAYSEPVPTITVDPAIVNATAAGLDGTITVTYENITDIAADVYFCDSEGNSADYDWLDAEINNENNIYYVVDANTGDARTAYMKVYAVGNEGEAYSDLITISQAAYVAPSASGDWVATNLTDITEDDVFVIVGNNGSTYAISNNGGTSSAPTAVAVSVSDGKLTAAPDDIIKWNLSVDKDGYTFYPSEDTDNWLYCTNTNNGVRVGTGDAKHFSLSDGYLTTTETTDQRYIGIYNSQDWRCYTNTTGNIADQSFYFYKKESAIVTLAASGYATYCCDKALDFTNIKKMNYRAWYVSNVSSTTVTCKEITGTVHAGEGIILYGNPGAKCSLPYADSGEGEELTDNMLVGTLVPTYVETVSGDYTNFGLSDGKFVKISGTIPANKAYLPILTANIPSGVKAFSFVFEDDPDGINSLTPDFSEGEGAIYNLAGQRIDNSQFTIHNSQLKRGIYIVNGKKILK